MWKKVNFECGLDSENKGTKVPKYTFGIHEYFVSFQCKI